MANFTLEDAFQQHYDLLEEADKGGNPTALVSHAQTLIEQARRMGRQIRSSQSREQLAGILSFWAKFVFDHTRVYPETSLYPLDPSLPGLRPAALAFDGTAQIVPTSTSGAQMLTPVSSAGILMVSITQPFSGSPIVAGTPIVIGGVYVNVRPEYRLFVISETADGQWIVVSSEIAPQPDQLQGTWASEPVTLESGLSLLGVCITVSKDALKAVRAAYEAGTVLDGVPDGALIFSRLCAVTVQSQP